MTVSFDVQADDARRFLSLLGGERFTFLVLPDRAADRGNASMRWEFSGTFDEALPRLREFNHRGAGIFVTINETDLKGRKAENITRVRALWHDDDKGGEREAPSIAPSMEIETSPGKFHRYWLVDQLGKDEFAACMDTMVRRFKSDPNAKDLPRVMRLPGFYHCKGEPFRVRIVAAAVGELFGPYLRDKVLGAFPPMPAERKEVTPSNASVNRGELLKMLGSIKADDRGDWLRVGMALHHEFGGDDLGRLYWDAWSQTSDKYDADEQSKAWDHFNADRTGEKVTLGSVVAMAKAGGYEPARRDATDIFKAPPAEALTLPGLEAAPAAPRRLFKPATEWIGREPKPQNWIVDGLVPEGFVTLLVANGGVGKSTMGAQLIASIAAGVPFLGQRVAQGAAAGLFCEDTDDRLHRLAKQAAAKSGVAFEALAPHIAMTSLLGEDSVLWAENGATAMLADMEAQAAELPGLKLLVLDGASDMFAASEIARAEVRGFMKAATDLAHRLQIGIVLMTHESRASASSDEHPTSGSTAWINSARSCLRLKSEKDKKGIRTLSHVKCNVGPMLNPMTLEYDGQYFVRKDNERAQALYDLIPEAIEAGALADRSYSINPRASNYFARCIADDWQPIAQYTVDEIASALEALRGFGRIYEEPHGRVREGRQALRIRAAA